MTLEEMGAVLRAEREKCRLSIDDVASELKINARVLTALENGDSGSLPHEAYVRGFIRSYAKALGIGPEEIQSWLDNLGAGSKAKEELKLAKPKPRKAGGGAFIVLIVLCLLAGVGWWAYGEGLLDPGRWRPAEKTALDSKLAPADKYLAERDARQEEAAKPVEPVTVESVTIESAEVPQKTQQPDLGLPPEAAPVARQQPVAQNQPEAEKPAAAGPVQHKLVITATEACWVHSNADKTDTRQFSLREGDTFVLPFTTRLELKLGNAGGVRLRYDGRDLPPAGKSGQVRTITFPPEND